jgi:hypothetical protein
MMPLLSPIEPCFLTSFFGCVVLLARFNQAVRGVVAGRVLQRISSILSIGRRGAVTGIARLELFEEFAVSF